MTGSSPKVAVFPGSFDPLTNGHLDLIRRGLSVFDRVIVAILVNSEKQPLLSVEERASLIREVLADEPRVSVDTFSGLLVDYAVRVEAQAIIRGLRAISDFEYEFQMALMNRRLNPAIETVFMMPRGAVLVRLVAPGERGEPARRANRGSGAQGRRADARAPARKRHWRWGCVADRDRRCRAGFGASSSRRR